MHESIANHMKIIGIHTFRAYNSPKELDDRFESLIALRAELSEDEYGARYNALFQELQRYKTREVVVKNLVTTVGRSVIAQRLSNIVTYTGIINYGVLGTSSTTPANGDTQLGTEVFRKVVASTAATSNNSFIDFFYSKADTNGTYNEFGTVIDGTASANTGQIFTHALTGGWTKASTESMTVSCQYTVN